METDNDFEEMVQSLSVSLEKSDEQFLSFLSNIHKYCKEHDCDFCKFNYSRGCVISRIAEEMRYAPSDWDLHVIELIVKEYIFETEKSKGE